MQLRRHLDLQELAIDQLARVLFTEADEIGPAEPKRRAASGALHEFKPATPDGRQQVAIHAESDGDLALSAVHYHRNYVFREALRPIYLFFDKQDIDEANMRMRKCPQWEQLEAVRDEVLKYAPGE